MMLECDVNLVSDMDGSAASKDRYSDNDARTASAVLSTAHNCMIINTIPLYYAARTQ